MIGSVELSRAVNALDTTLRDQRPTSLTTARLQAIVDGSLGAEGRLRVVCMSGDRARVTSLDGRTLASVGRRDGTWFARREIDATGSGWAVPDAS